MKRNDRCAKFCGGQILGIAQNLKLRGAVSEDFTPEVKPLHRLSIIPKDAYVLTCKLHGRDFLVRRAKS